MSEITENHKITDAGAGSCLPCHIVTGILGRMREEDEVEREMFTFFSSVKAK